MTTFEWLERVYALVSKNDTDTAIDIVLDEFDRFLSAAEFAKADEALKTVDISKLDVTLLLTVLSVTLCEKHRLPAREQFVLDTKQYLRSRSIQLLSGLS